MNILRMNIAFRGFCSMLNWVLKERKGGGAGEGSRMQSAIVHGYCDHHARIGCLLTLSKLHEDAIRAAAISTVSVLSRRACLTLTALVPRTKLARIKGYTPTPNTSSRTNRDTTQTFGRPSFLEDPLYCCTVKSER